MKVRRLALAIVFFALWVSAPAWAASKTSTRFSLIPSLLRGSFSQTGFGHESSRALPLAGGMEIQFGMNLGAFVFEISGGYHAPMGASSKDKASFAMVGGSLGLDLNVLPIEVFGGVEHGSLNFATASTTFTGPVLKAGVDLTLIAKGKFRLGARGQYRRHFIGSDRGGEIPDSFTTRGEYYSLGFILGWENH